MGKEDRIVKDMVKNLQARLGKHNAALLIALLCDLLDEFVEGVEERELRTLELKLNDYFSAKYDFEKEAIVNDGN